MIYWGQFVWLRTFAKCGLHNFIIENSIKEVGECGDFFMGKKYLFLNIFSKKEREMDHDVFIKDEGLTKRIFFKRKKTKVVNYYSFNC